MKKAILYAVLAVFCFSSCKKDKKTTPVTPVDTKTYSVKFRVSDLNGQKTTSTGTTKINDVIAIPPSVTRVMYTAVNSENKTVSFVTQNRGGDGTFGSIEDNLPPGTYTIDISAGTGILNGNKNSTYIQKELSSDYSNLSINNDAYWLDTFAATFKITVSDQPIDQPVSLKRIVGQVTVKLLDKLPANAYSLKVDVSNESDYYSFLTDKPVPYNPAAGYKLHTHSKTVLIPASAIGTTNFTQSYLILNTGSDINHLVNITCYDSAGKIIAQVNLPDVIIQRNTNTILSGKIFGSDSGFSITIDPNWGAPINIGF